MLNISQYILLSFYNITWRYNIETGGEGSLNKNTLTLQSRVSVGIWIWYLMSYITQRNCS